MTYFSKENVLFDVIGVVSYRPYRDINVYESEQERIKQMQSDMFVIKGRPERIILVKNERIRLHRMSGNCSPCYLYDGVALCYRGLGGEIQCIDIFKTETEAEAARLQFIHDHCETKNEDFEL